jgi:ABC-type branched-subunit amino acid transport system substrate-binding protein
MLRRTISGAGAGALTLAVLATAACGSTSPSGSGKGSVAPVSACEIFSLTGSIAGPANEFIDGAHVAVADINGHGGVLGQKVTEFVGDDANDAVDAVPALRQLLTHNCTFLSGPLSPTFAAEQPIIDSARIPDFAGIPGSQFDNLGDPYVYRTVVSDSLLGTAMAYYALSKGLMTCSILFENGSSAQGLVAPITDAYTRHGGKVLDNEQLVPHATSYRTELEKAFANSPQCIFAQADATTSGTLFAEMSELGHLNVPIVGTDEFIGTQIAHAVGLPIMNKWVTGMSGASPAGPSFTYFSGLYLQKYKIQPVEFAAATYDSVIIAGLAMTIAGTTDPKVWINDITKVTSNQTAPGCSTYKLCVSMIKAGQAMHYEGASGTMEWDSHHSVTAGIDVERFGLDGSLQPVLAITGVQLNGY